MSETPSDRRILLHFVTNYFTDWGQNLIVSGPGVLFGNYDVSRAHWATCHHAGKDLVWEVIVPVPLVAEITYKYAVVNESQEVLKWANEEHTVRLPEGLEEGAIVDIFDEWMDTSHPAHLLSRSAFTKVILANKPHTTHQRMVHLQPVVNEAIVRFQIWDWEVQEGEEVCISGGAAQLGNWQLHQVLQMTETQRACWEVEVSIPLNAFPVTYKYGIIGTGLMLEHGESRMVALPMTDTSRAPAMMVRNDGYFRRERRWQGAGVAVPVFSLRTPSSLGCGEFLDLLPLIDWCLAVGLHLIQILPVSDTSVRGTYRDSYPYSSLCVFALHPMYLNLEALVEGGMLPDGIETEIAEARKQLDQPDVDYVGTMEVKLRLSRKVFDIVGKQMVESRGFKEYYARNLEWLRPYAVFCLLKDLFGNADHWNWGTLSKPKADMLERLSSPEREWHSTYQYYCYLQYHLHLQLLRVSTYAASKHVALKGDLPIGVDKRSVDTWMHPKLFRMGMSTGAPPDVFDPNGQNWGFPTYNWEEMAVDGYLWWRRRLSHMAQYFHAYRIDHILGFFRIWELPGKCVTGLLGRFRPSQPLWRHELESHGIWDFDRLCDPYVTPAMLEKEFGEMASEVASRYFTNGPTPQRLKFRKQFAEEDAIFTLRAKPGLPESLAEEIENTRKGLLNLRQNVVLLRDPEDPERFYPRFALTQTSSFKDLDLHWRQVLAHLHDDYYFHRQDALWREQAHKTLPVLLAASDMLVCGEDLGMIPACVHPVMEEMGIIGLRIQRMPSEPDTEFGNPDNYPYMTVASPSSHDTSTTRAWYEADPERRERFYYQSLGGEPGGEVSGAAPPTCDPSVAAKVIGQHLDSPSVLAIFPLQDLMALSASLPSRPAEEETINDPTNAEHYWRYRMHVTVQEMAADSGLARELQGLLLMSGRCAEKEVAGGLERLAANGLG